MDAAGQPALGERLIDGARPAERGDDDVGEREVGVSVSRRPTRG